MAPFLAAPNNRRYADFRVLGFSGCFAALWRSDYQRAERYGPWINLSPFESDEFGVPSAFVHLITTAAENSLADAMHAAILAIPNELAGNNPAEYADHQPKPRWARDDVSRSRNTVDRDESSEFRHRHQWPFS